MKPANIGWRISIDSGHLLKIGEAILCWWFFILALAVTRPDLKPNFLDVLISALLPIPFLLIYTVITFLGVTLKTFRLRRKAPLHNLNEGGTAVR